MTLRVALAGETDLAGFRTAARRLLAQRVPPAMVQWLSAAPVPDDLFENAMHAGSPPPAGLPAAPVPRQPPASVPAWFVGLCAHVVLHRDGGRFALLYTPLWRLVHEPGLRHDALDPAVLQARHMAQAVRRDMHKMKAFLRFRPVPDPDRPGDPLHLAWFEPAHHIVEAVAPWFGRRFAGMRWSILTPDRSVAWDGQRLAYGPAATARDAPAADAGEALWLVYYQNIFNPARLKLQAMQKEMPRRYWPHLPEARLIAPLAAQAQARSEAMVRQPPSVPRRRIPPPVAPAVAGPTAGRPTTLAELRQATMRCRECPLGAQATQSVTGEGPLAARLMFVGEQPGDREDLEGRPFVGPAGQLLDRALAALGLPRDQVFVSNAVRHFKFELRGRRRIHKTPSQREAAACLHWLDDEIRLVRPGALVALGATAARALLGRPVAVTAERGRWLQRDDGLAVLVTLHPSALLRMPPEQREAGYAAFLGDLAQARALFEAPRARPADH